MINFDAKVSYSHVDISRRYCSRSNSVIGRSHRKFDRHDLSRLAKQSISFLYKQILSYWQHVTPRKTYLKDDIFPTLLGYT